LLEFTTRQILITRVYDPRTWRTLLVTQSVFNIAFWGGLLFQWPFWLVTPAVYLLAGIKSYVRYQAVAGLLPEGALSKNRRSYILLAPLTALLFEYTHPVGAHLKHHMATDTTGWPSERTVVQVAATQAEHADLFVTSTATQRDCASLDELNRPGPRLNEIVEPPRICLSSRTCTSGGEPTPAAI
jgi:hypothetical protein